jgi:hypothetical protein
MVWRDGSVLPGSLERRFFGVIYRGQLARLEIERDF